MPFDISAPPVGASPPLTIVVPPGISSARCATSCLSAHPHLDNLIFILIQYSMVCPSVSSTFVRTYHRRSWGFCAFFPAPPACTHIIGNGLCHCSFSMSTQSPLFSTSKVLIPVNSFSDNNTTDIYPTMRPPPLGK